MSIRPWLGIRSTFAACFTGVALLACVGAAAGEPRSATTGRPGAAPREWAARRPLPPDEPPDDEHWGGWDPAARNIAVYDRHRDRLLRFDRERVWSYSLRGHEGWSVVYVEGELPPPRRWAAQVYDSDRNRVIVHGGMGDGRFLGDTWQLSLDDPPTWSRLVTRGDGPEGIDFAAIYDPVRRQMIISGGYGNTAYPPPRDVWALPLQGEPEWRRLSASGPRRGGHAAVYDPAGDRMIVFGGGWAGPDSWYTFNDVWAFPLGGGDTWSQLHAGGFSDQHPLRRAFASMTYDPAEYRLILVGGLVPGAFPKGPFEDAWEFLLDGLRWQPIGLPEARPRWWQPAAAYDLHRRRLLLSEFDWLWSLDLRTRGPRPRPEEASRADAERRPERASASGLVLSVQGSRSFRAHIDAEVSLLEGSPARLELFDVLGRRIRSQALAPVQAERQRVRMEGVAGLPSGVYLLQLTQTGRSRVVRLVHAR